LKKIAVAADTHCGHAVGLTPPLWQQQDTKSKLHNVRQQCWDFFERNVEQRGPFDLVIFNGDAIDGKGAKAEGVETIFPDRFEQVKMANFCIKKLLTPNLTKLVMTFGTDYHTGAGEDFEQMIADECHAERIGNIAHVEIEGIIFEAKHHVGSSQVSHTRHTAVARDHQWNILWAERGVSPKANIIIRSHVHYYDFCGGPDWVAMTTPALQGFGSRFGARRMSGIVDFGFIVFTVDNGRFSWEPILASVEAQQSTVIKL
jgi:hypothetical protein